MQVRRCAGCTAGVSIVTPIASPSPHRHCRHVSGSKTWSSGPKLSPLQAESMCLVAQPAMVYDPTTNGVIVLCEDSVLYRVNLGKVTACAWCHLHRPPSHRSRPAPANIHTRAYAHLLTCFRACFLRPRRWRCADGDPVQEFTYPTSAPTPWGTGLGLDMALMHASKPRGQVVLTAGLVRGADTPILTTYVMDLSDFSWSEEDLDGHPPFGASSGTALFNPTTQTMIMFFQSYSSDPSVWYLDMTSMTYGCQPLVGSLDHGTLSCSDGNKVGSVCSVSCASGFHVSGNANRTCSAAGQGGNLWSGAPASCVGACRAWPCAHRSTLA